MNSETIQRVQQRLESVTKRWPFILLLLLIQFIPSYISVPVDFTQIAQVMSEAFADALIYSFRPVFFVFKIVPLVLILSIPFFKNRIGRVFALYAGISYVLFAVLQSVALSDTYGLVIATSNLVMFLMVGALWFWEVFAARNDLSTPVLTPSRLWVVPLAAMAFWYPIDTPAMTLNLNPLGIITNDAGLTFCMMTPVYLALLSIYYPRVNLATFRVTGMVGTIIGLYNVLLNFIWYPAELFWNGVFHIPLIVISIYAVILSFGKTDRPS